MPRKSRKYVRAPFYHIMCQGIKKENIFNSEIDMKKYLSLIKKYKDEFFIDVIAYCIMSNHVHLLLHSRDINYISKFMHKINLIYAMNYNESNKRVGYVFRDRFRMEEITEQKYFYACISYIHNNPVNAKICSTPFEYKFSSYHEFNETPSIINPKIIENFFGETFDASNDYGNFIFLDIENNQELIAKEIVKNFEILKNKNILQILQNYRDKKELLVELHIKNKISYRCIEKILPIERRKIPTYLYDQKGQV